MAVELSVKSQLTKLIDDLKAVQGQAEQVGKALEGAGKDVGDELEKQTKKTETFFSRLQGLGGRVATQLRQDFRTLLSINALQDSLKLSNQFKGAVSEVISLNDTIRKLGPTLGIAERSYTSFAARVTRTLGQLGLSTEAANAALSGLAETSVKGDQNALTQYSVRAGQLASISREQGREGDIAKGLAGVVVARGKQATDVGEMEKAAADVLRIRNATGKSATEIVQALQGLYSNANPRFRKQLDQGGATSLAAASLFGGQGATSFLERYLGQNVLQNLPGQAQGLGRLIGKDGTLNAKAFDAVASEARGRGLGDAQAGLKTFGLSDEEAKGFLRLNDALKQNAAAIEQARTAVVDINTQYRESRGLGESFRASLNRVKSLVAEPIAKGADFVRGGLSKAADSDLGAAGVALGGGAFAALLAGIGTRGIGKALGLPGVGGLATAAGIEGATGRQVVPVYVTNFSDFGTPGLSGLGGFGKAAGAGGLLAAGKIAAAGGAAFLGGAAVGYGLDKAGLNPVTAIDNRTRSTNADGFEGTAIERLIYAIDKLADGKVTGLSKAVQARNEMRILVESKDPMLKATPKPGRGASTGP